MAKRGRPTGTVTRLADGEWRDLVPEGRDQRCPVCDRQTWRARAVGEPDRWYRFEDVRLNVPHDCPGIGPRLAAVTGPTLRVIGGGRLPAQAPGETATAIPLPAPMTRRPAVSVGAVRRDGEGAGPVEPDGETAAALPTSGGADPGPATLSATASPTASAGDDQAAATPGHDLTTASPGDDLAAASPAGDGAERGDVEADAGEPIQFEPSAPESLPGGGQAFAPAGRDAGRARPVASPSDTRRPSTLRLQPLIDATPAGGTVTIPAGLYREPLTIRGDRTLVAEGGDVTLAPAPGPAIVVVGARLELRGITLRPGSGDGVIVLPGIGVRTGARTVIGLTDCVVEAPGRAVAATTASVSVRMSGTVVRSATGSGVALDDAGAVRLTGCQVTTGGGPGISAGARAVVQLSGVTISRCGGPGVRVGARSVVWADSGDPVVVRDNRGDGFALGDGSTLTMRDGEIITNRDWGVRAPGGTVTVAGVTNAANGFGALAPTGAPTLVGEWVTWAPAVGGTEGGEPSTGRTGAVGAGDASAPVAGTSPSPMVADGTGASEHVPAPGADESDLPLGNAGTAAAVASGGTVAATPAPDHQAEPDPVGSEGSESVETGVAGHDAPVARPGSDPDPGPATAVPPGPGESARGRVFVWMDPRDDELIDEAPSDPGATVNGAGSAASPRQAVHPSRARADEALLRLAQVPEIERVRLQDPRFRWLVRSLPPAVAREETVVRAFERATTFPVVPEATLDLLYQAVEYAEWLATVGLAEELAGIVAPVVGQNAQWADRMLTRLGWAGDAPRTLQDVSDDAGVTRERVRQVQVRVESVLKQGFVWAPALDRTLALLADHVPATRSALDRLLAAETPEGDRAVDLDGILAARTLLDREVPLIVVERHGVEFVTLSLDDGDPALGRFAIVRAAIRRRVGNQGVATVGEVVTLLAEQGETVTPAEVQEVAAETGEYRVEDGYLLPTRHDTRNPLASRLDKLLALAPGLRVEVVAAQLGRDERRGYPVPAAALRLFATHHPDYTLTPDDRLLPVAPLSLVDALSPTELALVAAFRTRGPELSFTELHDLLVGPGFSRVTLAVRLGDSPLFVRLGRNRYRLVTADDEPATEPAPAGDAAGPGATVEAADPFLPVIAEPIPGAGDEGSVVRESPTATGPAGPDVVPDDDIEDEAGGVAGAVVDTVDDEAPAARGPGSLPVLRVPEAIGQRVPLPDPVVVPLHRLVADLLAGRVAWPAETRRQRWSPARLPDLLDGIYHGLPMAPVVVRPRPADGDGGSGPLVSEIVDGQQRLGLLARLVNPHYRIPGQPQLPPSFVAFRPAEARFSLAVPADRDDPLVLADIGPLLRDEASLWRVTTAWLARLRTAREIDDATADQLAASIANVAAIRAAPIVVQRLGGTPDAAALTDLYDRLHRG